MLICGDKNLSDKKFKKKIQINIIVLKKILLKLCIGSNIFIMFLKKITNWFYFKPNEKFMMIIFFTLNVLLLGILIIFQISSNVNKNIISVSILTRGISLILIIFFIIMKYYNKSISHNNIFRYTIILNCLSICFVLISMVEVNFYIILYCICAFMVLPLNIYFKTVGSVNFNKLIPTSDSSSSDTSFSKEENNHESLF